MTRMGMIMAVGLWVWVGSADAKFLPDNDLKIPVGDVKVLGLSMTEAQFNEIISDVEQIYAPIISQQGGRLVVNRLWSNATVNAQAYRNGRNWYVDMFGGLARHPAVTADALALVVCHEVGHHIGGHPKYSEAGNTWASVEGQADYFSTLKCLRKLFENQNNEVANEDPAAREKCEQAFGLNSEADLCVRMAMAGLSAANMFKELSGGAAPGLDRRDSRVVQQTFESHPQAQCRLDTYFEGALCGVDHEEDVSQSHPEPGTCHRKVTGIVGYRPLCWYKPIPNASEGETATAPGLNGQENYQTSNPNGIVTVSWDVSSFVGAAGVYVEVSQPNQAFNNPNGVEPAANALGGATFRGVRSSFRFRPSATLPGWGSYQLRVIPLDSSGRFPLGRFSNSSQLILQSGR